MKKILWIPSTLALAAMAMLCAVVLPPTANAAPIIANTHATTLAIAPPSSSELVPATSSYAIIAANPASTNNHAVTLATLARASALSHAPSGIVHAKGTAAPPASNLLVAMNIVPSIGGGALMTTHAMNVNHGHSLSG